jgi:hypothetical protein
MSEYAIYHNNRVYIDAEEFLARNLEHVRKISVPIPEDTNPALIQLTSTVWLMVRIGRWMIEGKYAPVEYVERWLRHHFPATSERFFVQHLRCALVCDEAETFDLVEHAIDIHPITQDDMRRALA